MNEAVEFDLFDFSIKGLKSRDTVSFSGDIPFYNIAEAAQLLIHSQQTGIKLKITAEIVESEPGDLA